VCRLRNCFAYSKKVERERGRGREGEGGRRGRGQRERETLGMTFARREEK